jgi:hypothetical protein
VGIVVTQRQEHGARLGGETAKHKQPRTAAGCHRAAKVSGAENARNEPMHAAHAGGGKPFYSMISAA